MKRLLTVLFTLYPVLAQSAVEEEKKLGWEFAQQLLYPFTTIFGNAIDLSSGAFPGIAGSPISLLQFFAGALLVYFFVTEFMNAERGLSGLLLTVIAMSWMNYILIIDWYVFLLDVAPAILVFMLVRDLMAMSTVVQGRTVKMIAFFGFAITYYFRPTDVLFQRMFVQPTALLVGGGLATFVVLLAFTRMFAVTFMSLTQRKEAMEAQSGMEAMQSVAKKIGGVYK